MVISGGATTTALLHLSIYFFKSIILFIYLFIYLSNYLFIFPREKEGEERTGGREELFPQSWGAPPAFQHRDS